MHSGLGANALNVGPESYWQACSLFTVIVSGSRAVGTSVQDLVPRARPPVGRQHIVPHTPGAVGAFATQEAGFDESPDPFIAARAGARPSGKPRQETPPRNIQCLAKQPHRP